MDSSGIPVLDATSGEKHLAGKLEYDTDVSYEIDEQATGQLHSRKNSSL